MAVNIKQEPSFAYCEPNPNYDKAMLYLTTFPNKIGGGNLEGVQFTRYGKLSSSSDKLIDKDNLKNKCTILVADSGSMQYSGSSKDECLQQITSDYKFLVGVVNKRTEKLKFFSSTMIHCKPVLRESQKTSNEFEQKSYIEKVDVLTTDYGTKRKRKAVESRARHLLKVGGDETNFANVIKEATMKIQEQYKDGNQKMKTDVESPIPPRNNAATSVETVYNLKDIISEDEFIVLDGPSEVFRNLTLADIRQWGIDEKYGAFVCHFLEIYYGNITAHKAKLLMYFHYMMVLLKLTYRELRKKDPAPGIPKAIKDYLMNKYVAVSTDDNGRINRTMPPKMKDKIMAHSMVLTLILSSYSVDAAYLQRDYKVPIQKLSKIAYALGCHVSSKKRDGMPVKYIELKLPLYVPNDKPFVRRKGRN